MSAAGSHVGHHVNVCEYGYVHGQCRCIEPNKAVVRIECPLGTEFHPDGGIRYAPDWTAEGTHRPVPAAAPMVRTRYRVKVWVEDDDHLEVPIFVGEIGDDDTFALSQTEGSSTRVSLTATAAVGLALAPELGRPQIAADEQRVCADCGDPIVFVPQSGFGATAQWQHRQPVSLGRSSPHPARPKVHVW